MSSPHGEQGDGSLLLAVTLCALVLRVYGLAGQPPTSDDLGVTLSAVNYLEGGQLGPTMWNHPALRNFIAYGMLKLCGPGLVGTVGVNLLLGTLCTPLIHRVALRFTGDQGVALSAALLWAVEPLAVEYSRQAINDIYLAFFPLLGILAVYRFLDGGRAGWLLAAGVAFGLGLASKWSALFQLAVMGLLIAYRLLFRSPAGAGIRMARGVFACSALAVLPLTIYLLTFAPWFSRGYSLAEWPALQQSMYRETKLHTGYKKAIYGDHKAFLWFVRPGISHEDYIFSLPEGGPGAEPDIRHNLTVLMAVANPLVWLAVLPALCIVIRRAWRGRSEGETVLVALLLFSYLPLALAGRPVWFNTGVVVLPYVVIVVAAALRELAPAGGKGWRRRFGLLYLGLACLVSLCLYPLAIGRGFELPLVGDYLVEKTRHIQGVGKEMYGPRHE